MNGDLLLRDRYHGYLIDVYEGLDSNRTESEITSLTTGKVIKAMYNSPMEEMRSRCKRHINERTPQ